MNTQTNAAPAEDGAGFARNLTAVRAVLEEAVRQGEPLRIILPNGEGAELPSDLVATLSKVVDELSQTEQSIPPHGAMDRLVALSEELGLYEITEFPDPALYRRDEFVG